MATFNLPSSTSLYSSVSEAEEQLDIALKENVNANAMTNRTPIILKLLNFMLFSYCTFMPLIQLKKMQ